VSRIRGRSGERSQARVGAPDVGLTASAGLAAVTEMCGRLDVIGAIDAATGPIKQRDRGFSAGELLTGIAAAQLAGEDFLVGLDRQRADAAGQRLTPVPGLSSTAAAGLARRVAPGHSVPLYRRGGTGTQGGAISPIRRAVLAVVAAWRRRAARFPWTALAWRLRSVALFRPTWRCSATWCTADRYDWAGGCQILMT